MDTFGRKEKKGRKKSDERKSADKHDLYKPTGTTYPKIISTITAMFG